MPTIDRKLVGTRILSREPMRIAVDYEDDGEPNTVIKTEATRPAPEGKRCVATRSGTQGLIRCGAYVKQGLTVCIKHGGMGRMAKIERGGEPNSKAAHGLYPSIVDRAVEKANDPDLLSLNQRIAERMEWLEYLQKQLGDEVDAEELDRIFKMHGDIDKATVEAFKMIYGERYSISATSVQEMAQGIIGIMRRHLSTCPHCHESLQGVGNNIALAIGELMSAPHVSGEPSMPKALASGEDVIDVESSTGRVE